MNYRHAFHAGNFADVVKHAILARLVDYLKRKDKAFRVIDTHAGTGLYDLQADPSQRTGEYEAGISRLFGAPLPEPARHLLAPYMDAVAAANAPDEFRYYPGSPAIVRHLMRKQDRLTAIERHPQDARLLADRFAGDHQVRVIELDGWLALGAHLPPKEKRGLVLVDPPFEETDEFGRLAEGLARAVRRWPGGIYALWYPIKDRAALSAFRDSVIALGLPRVLDIRFHIRPPSRAARLDGTGMVVVNPPFTLETELGAILPALLPLLADDRGAGFSIESLATEKPGA